MGKYKNKCLINFKMQEAVEYLESLGYIKSENSENLPWALAIITDPETTTYKGLNSVEIVNISKLPLAEKPRFSYSFEEFQKLVSELNPDYVEPEPEEQPAETEAVLGEAAPAEPEVVDEKPAPKKKTTRKKTTKTTETND